MQLRLLQTVVEVAAEKNSTLVVPVRVELLRFFDRAASAIAQLPPSAAQTQDTATPSALTARALPVLIMPASLPADAA